MVAQVSLVSLATVQTEVLKIKQRAKETDPLGAEFSWSSHPSFWEHVSRRCIFPNNVKGHAKPRRSYIIITCPKTILLVNTRGKAWGTSSFSRFGPVYIPLLFLLKLRVTSNTTVSCTGFQQTPQVTFRISPVPFNMFMCVWTEQLAIVTFSFLAHKSLPGGS